MKVTKLQLQAKAGKSTTSHDQLASSSENNSKVICVDFILNELSRRLYYAVCRSHAFPERAAPVKLCSTNGQKYRCGEEGFHRATSMLFGHEINNSVSETIPCTTRSFASENVSMCVLNW